MSLSLFKIVDILQVPLEISKGVVKGGGDIQIPSAVDGLTLTLKVKPVAYFRGLQMGVVVHVAGSLYVMASHFDETGGSCAMVIDGSKAGNGWIAKIIPTMDLRDVLNILKPAVVGSYFYKDGWNTMALPA